MFKLKTLISVGKDLRCPNVLSEYGMCLWACVEFADSDYAACMPILAEHCHMPMIHSIYSSQ